MKIILFVFVSIFFSVQVFSQKINEVKEKYKNGSVISPAFVSYESIKGTISWTLGDTLISLKIGDSDSNAPGILEFDFDIVAYPNPTNGNLTISHNSKTDENLTFTIYDFNGRTLIRRQLIEHNNEINLQYLPAALYEVKITDPKNHSVESFKIVKH